MNAFCNSSQHVAIRPIDPLVESCLSKLASERSSVREFLRMRPSLISKLWPRLRVCGILAMGSIAAWGGESYRISGRVQDSATAPVSNAAVQLVKSAQHGREKIVTETRTHKDGRFEIGTAGHTKVALRVLAPGFNEKFVLLGAEGVRKDIDVGTIWLAVSCSGPGVVCDDVTSPLPPRSHKR